MSTPGSYLEACRLVLTAFRLIDEVLKFVERQVVAQKPVVRQANGKAIKEE